MAALRICAEFLKEVPYVPKHHHFNHHCLYLRFVPDGEILCGRHHRSWYAGPDLHRYPGFQRGLCLLHQHQRYAASGGKITRKHTYLPLAMGGLIGGTGSLAGSTAPLLANDVLQITG